MFWYTENKVYICRGTFADVFQTERATFLVDPCGSRLFFTLFVVFFFFFFFNSFYYLFFLSSFFFSPPYFIWRIFQVDIIISRLCNIYYTVNISFIKCTVFPAAASKLHGKYIPMQMKYPNKRRRNTYIDFTSERIRLYSNFYPVLQIHSLL